MQAFYGDERVWIRGATPTSKAVAASELQTSKRRLFIHCMEICLLAPAIRSCFATCYPLSMISSRERPSLCRRAFVSSYI